MYRVLFLCRARPSEGWQGKGEYPTQQAAELWAVVLQGGTRGQAIVLDAAGQVIFSVG